MNIENLSNTELINHIYTNIAAKELQNKIKDWTDGRQWKRVVSELDRPVQLVYRIAILNMQVMNGGFLQYFDNRYGIFAYETLEDLKLIEATKSYNLLAKSLLIVNPQNHKDERFFRYIFEHEYNSVWEMMCGKIEPLNDEYYALDGHEDLELLMSTYLGKNL